ncbi:MAG: TonB-dependent receptor plug domain-containing protein [Gemmatimonadetes bacterium]|nr:TonB-dependent receptor plug domain-containing protein [Gemmatimonadota bacterium]
MKNPLCFARLLLAAPVLFALVACGPARTTRYASDLEPVKVGYGTQFRGDVTGSVTSLAADELNGQRVSRVEEMLQDRVSGVTVSRKSDGSYSVRVRGTRSLLASNEPLVVIDGVPVNAQSVSLAVTGLSPQDVASVEILKGAAATAIYGSRGANGVILITTRRDASR